MHTHNLPRLQGIAAVTVPIIVALAGCAGNAAAMNDMEQPDTMPHASVMMKNGGMTKGNAMSGHGATTGDNDKTMNNGTSRSGTMSHANGMMDKHGMPKDGALSGNGDMTSNP